MKKLLTLSMVGMLLITLLTGCGKEDETAERTITVGRWGGNDVETAGFNQVIEDFTKETGIKVVEKVYTDYNVELQTELIGGTAPDVFYVEAYMAPFLIEQGVLAPLDSKEFELDSFYSNLTEAFKGSDGKFYAAPKDYSTLALYYNKAYVNEEDIPKSLEELYNSSFLSDLQAKLPEGMTAMTYEQELARNLFMAENGGVSITDKDNVYSQLSNDKVVENLTPLYDAAAAGKVKTVQDLGVGWNGDAFGNEKTAIMIEGNWVIGFMNENFSDVEYGVVELPVYKGESGTMTFTVGYALNAASKNSADAQEFIKYATGQDGMKTWASKAGVLPARADVTEALNLTDDPVMAAHIAGAAYATPWQKGTTLETINNTYKNYMPSVVKGERTLAEAMKVIDEEANKIIKDDTE